MAEQLLQDHHALRAVFLYEYLQGHTSSEARRNLCTVLGEDIISLNTIKNWFKKFQEGSFDLNDKPRSGRPRSDIDGDISDEMKREPRASVRDISSSIGLSSTTTFRHLHSLGMAPKFGQVVPHELTDDQKSVRCDLALSLLTRKRRTDWIKDITTGDEKWVLYVNHTRKRQWVPEGEAAQPDPKGELHEKKVMLSIWWDSKGVIFRELLPDHATINSSLYCTQLEKMVLAHQSLRPKGSKLLLLHDNARPHTSLMTRQKLQALGVEVLPHPPYSPDLAPTDYHLFRSLQNHLAGQRFHDREAVEKGIDEFFASKSPEFYESGISQLPMRWQEVIDSDGQYIKY